MKNNLLGDLLRNLNTAEKAIVLKRADKEYAPLIQFIYKQEIYDEAAVIAKFRNTRFVKAFHKTRKKLADIILDALTERRTEDTSRLQLLIARVELLMRKNLCHHIDVPGLEAIHLAKAQQQFMPGMHVSRLARIAYSSEESLGNEMILISPENISALEKEFVRDYFNYEPYETLHIALRRRFNRHILSEAEHHLLDHPENCTSTRALIECHICRYHRCRHQGHYDLAIRELEQLMEIYNQHPTLTADPSLQPMWLNFWSDFSILNRVLKNFEATQNAIQNLEKINRKHKGKDIRVWERLTLMEIDLATYTYIQEPAGDFEQRITAGLRSHAKNISPLFRIVLPHTLSVYFLHHGQPREAIRHIKHLMDQPLPSIRRDLYFHAFLLFLISHTYKGNDAVILQQAPLVRKFLRKHNLLSAFEETLIAGLERHASVAASDKRDVLLKLSAEITDDLKQSGMEGKENYFDVLRWIEAMLKNITIFELMQLTSDE